jgi:hypothetical protein
VIDITWQLRGSHSPSEASLNIQTLDDENKFAQCCNIIFFEKLVNTSRLSYSKASLKVGGQERKSLGTVGGSGDQSARKWKSMFDVSGGKLGSSNVNTVSGPASPTKSSRAKTPTLSVFTGQSNISNSGVSRRTSSPSAMRYGIMHT